MEKNLLASHQEENYDLSCPFCQTPVDFNRFRCLHCASDLSYLSLQERDLDQDEAGFALSPAPPYKRYGAFLVDLCLSLLGVPILIIGLVRSQSFLVAAESLDALFSFLLHNFVGMAVASGWFLVYYLARDGWKGAGIGKRLFGLLVVETRLGLPCRLDSSAIRHGFSLFLGITIIGPLVEGVLLTFHPEGLRPGDYLAGTRVVAREDYYVRR